MKNSEEQLRLVMWGTSVLAVVLSVTVWGQYINWKLDGLSAYDLFPLLGLMAFGLMWSHYVTAAFRLKSNLSKEITSSFFEVTSLVVLGLILLHPGLLIFSLWKDGFGLPPDSYLENYVAPSLKWAALLGTLSLLVFLTYEARRWYSQKSWWRFVQYASDVAMIAIIIHGFRLGTHLQTGWFRSVWIFYTVSLLISIVVIRTSKDKLKEKQV